MARTIKVIANVQRSIANIDGVLQRAVRHRYQVVCIQEPPTLFGRVRRHPGFTLYAIDDNSTWTADSRPRLQWLQILAWSRSPSTALLSSTCTYILTPISPLTHGARSAPSRSPPGPTVVVGDFNTHHPDWDPRARPNPKGDMVRAWIASRELSILNPPGPTHRGGSVVDLVLGPPRTFAEFAHWASDHRALVVSVPSRPPQCLPPPKRLPRSHLEESARLLQTLLPTPPASLPDREGLEQYAWTLFDVLAGIAGRFSVRPDKHTKSATSWSDVLATARETDPIVYRQLCKEVRVNFYREKVASASTPSEGNT